MATSPESVPRGSCNMYAGMPHIRYMRQCRRRQKTAAMPLTATRAAMPRTRTHAAMPRTRTHAAMPLTATYAAMPLATIYAYAAAMPLHLEQCMRQCCFFISNKHASIIDNRCFYLEALHAGANVRTLKWKTASCFLTSATSFVKSVDKVNACQSSRPYKNPST